LAGELRDTATRISALESDDLGTSLPAVLSWSYQALTPQQREVFSLLGTAPGPDTGLSAVASLTALPREHTRRLLSALEEASLLDQDGHGRYRMHDIVRAYAAATDVVADVREAALRRALDFYTHTAYAADRLLDPHRVPPVLDPAVDGIHLDRLPDATAAMAWFDADHACLLAAQHTAATNRRYLTVWHLAWGLTTFHLWRGHRHDMLTVWQAAADASTHLPDPSLLSRAHRALGRTYADLGRHDKAIEHLSRALDLAERHRDSAQQAHIHRALARAWGQRGDDQQALNHVRRALNLYRGIDHPVSEARALNAMGWHAARLGEHDDARSHCQAALALHRHHRSVDGEAGALDNLGYIEHHSGRHTQAVDYYRDALTLRRELGHSYYVAETLDRLGHPHTALGHVDQARRVWLEAMKLYRDQGRDNDAVRIQRQLDDLDTSDAGGSGFPHATEPAG
jgi:tetratricopeptide (TPR) repeat protein